MRSRRWIAVRRCRRNALDATKLSEEPEIEILLAAGETVRLTVRDNGPGIEDLDELFEPLAQ